MRTKKYIKEYLSLGFIETDYRFWYGKFDGLRSRTKTRNGVECFLTFLDYLSIAKQSGLLHPSQIGRGLDEFCMARIGDSGDYALGNCRFITNRHNYDERLPNGVYDRISKALMGRKNPTHSSKLTGRTKHSHSHLETLSQSMLGLTKHNSEQMAKMADTKSKRYRLISPNGEIFEGKNLNQFCIDNDIWQSPMSELCRGVRQQYKGWVGSYVYE